MHSLSLLFLYHSVKTHRSLLKQIVLRDIYGRYRGSVLGLAWTVISPLLLLAVYTFMFTVVFKARWQGATTVTAPHEPFFAVMAFSGLIVYMFFAECISRAPAIVLGNANLVKKVVFPLELFPLMLLGTGFFHFCINLVLMLLTAMIITGQLPPFTLLYLPLILLPFMLLMLGLCWFLAALGVFLRDIAQLVQFLLTFCLFLSPVFYPVSALPEAFQPLLYLNPVTCVIEQLRRVAFEGIAPEWFYLTCYSFVAVIIASLGFACFQKARNAFADVL